MLVLVIDLVIVIVIVIVIDIMMHLLYVLCYYLTLPLKAFLQPLKNGQNQLRSAETKANTRIGIDYEHEQEHENPRRKLRTAWLLVVSVLLLIALEAQAGRSARAEIEPGITATFQDGRALFLECRPPKGGDAEAFFGKCLADPGEWRVYKDRMAVAIPFDRVNPEMRRKMLLALFPKDYVDKDGWWHTALYSGKEGQETLWVFCEWVTGKGTNYRNVTDNKHNRLTGSALQSGQRILIPANLLLEVMRQPTPKNKHKHEEPKPEESKDDESKLASEEEPPLDLEEVSKELTYGSDDQGAYALYRLKPGEALYSAVVVRFTDYKDNELIQTACQTLQKRSGIKDVRDMKAGQKILIPIDMLSDRFLPSNTEQRKEYEETIVEAKRLRKQRIGAKDLEGIVVVIDPGHGGRDHGAQVDKLDLYEDELNYDIACRVKEILETKTRARTYMTVLDKSQGYKPSESKRFTADTDEVVLTTPNYENTDAKVSVNMRWYLANAIYRAEVKKGTEPRKMVFTSFHTDAQFNAGFRGAMIYIPGAKYRREHEEPVGDIYNHIKEAQGHRRAESTAIDRRRDEALSRNFADDLMQALGRHHIHRHTGSDWIRSQIRQDGGRVYVPGVLRNTLIPVKILIESANMTNKADCKNLADPQWRQAFAEAYVDALRAYFGS